MSQIPDSINYCHGCPCISLMNDGHWYCGLYRHVLAINRDFGNPVPLRCNECTTRKPQIIETTQIPDQNMIIETVMGIEEIRKRKKAIEREIEKIIDQFVNETKVNIENIQYNTFNSESYIGGNCTQKTKHCIFIKIEI